MRKHRDVLWLGAVIVFIALGARWLKVRAMEAPPPRPDGAQVWKGGRGATVVRVGEAFELKVHGPGELMFRPHREGGLERLRKAYLSVDPRDGDLIRVDDRAHLFPKVQLNVQAKTLEILPDGRVLAGTGEGSVYEVGRVLLAMGEVMRAPGEAGVGEVLVYPAPTPVPRTMYPNNHGVMGAEGARSAGGGSQFFYECPSSAAGRKPETRGVGP
ncbi:MAG: hypothetical protein FJX76_04615 [Armatimonadetes bacterium]|nr:hypothetical protein [Armatimonadota bacterium]